MKLPRILENAIMAAINGVAVLGVAMIIAGLLRLPDDVTKILASVSFILGFIAAFIIFAIVQSIPDEDD